MSRPHGAVDVRRFPCCVHCNDARDDHVEHGGTVEKDGHDVPCDTCLYDAEVERRVAQAVRRFLDSPTVRAAMLRTLTDVGTNRDYLTDMLLTELRELV